MSNNQHHENLVDKGWSQMSTLLDREMPTDKVGFWPYWWMAGIGILLLGLLGGYLWLHNDDSLNTTDETAVYSENVNFDKKQSRDGEYEKESLAIEPPGTAVNAKSTAFDGDIEQQVQRQIHSNKKHSLSQSNTITKVETQPHVQSPDNGIEPFENSGFHLVEIAEEEIRDGKQSAIDPLASMSLSLIPMDVTLPEGTAELKTTVVDGYSRTIFPVVNLGTSTNFMDNASLSFRAGAEYSFSRRWSTTTLLGYQMSHIRANNSFVSNNTNGLFDGIDISFPSNESTQYNIQLTYGNITQHLLTASQHLNYNIFSSWSVYMGAGIAYEAYIQSEGSIQENYPVFVGNDQLQYRNRTLDANDFESYSADWYGMIELGAEFRIHNNWSLNAGISTLQSLHSDKDHLGLNQSRRLQFDLGIKWEI